MKKLNKTLSPAQTSSAEKKKLVQARLPFKIISTVVKEDTPITKDVTTIETRKRKLSSSATEDRNFKLIKSAAIKENLLKEPIPVAVIDIIDDNVDVPDDSKINKTNSKATVSGRKKSLNKNNSTIKTKTRKSVEKSHEKLAIKLPTPKRKSFARKLDTSNTNNSSKHDNNDDDDDDDVISIEPEEPVVVKELKEKHGKKAKEVPEMAEEPPKQSSSKEKNDLSDSELSNDDSSASISCVKETKMDGKSTNSDENDQEKSDSGSKQTDNDVSITENADLTTKPKGQLKRRGSQRKNDERQKEKEKREQARLKEKEEKEEQRKKEKENRDKKRQSEIDQRNEEKRKKDEQREEERKKRDDEKRKKEEERIKKEEDRKEKEKAKEEEKRKKEDERKKKELEKEEERKKKELEKEGEEIKKKRISEAFTKFFVVKENAKKPEEINAEKVTSEEPVHKFMPFCIKGDMKLAPQTRRSLNEDSRCQLEKLFTSGTIPVTKRKNLYIVNLRSKKYTPRKQGKTWLPIDEDTDDVVVVEEELKSGIHGIEKTDNCKKTYRAKFISFHENQRPAYYGTFRKKSKCIKGRKPFAEDTMLFDYEVDSDDEWEEEEIGESLHGSDDEKEKVSEDEEYEEDFDFFVPHGHLSDEELQNDDEVEEDNSATMQKAKLKIVLQKEFAAEWNKKTERIKPRLYGCIWQNVDGTRPDSCPPVVWDMFAARAMVCNGDIRLAKTEEEYDNEEQSGGNNKQILMNDEEKKDLIRLIHGNTNNRNFLIKEFQTFQLRKMENSPQFKFKLISTIKNQMKEFAVWQQCPKEGAMFTKYCWYVRAEFLENYNLLDLPIPNEWSYNLQLRSKPVAERTEKNKLRRKKQNDEESPKTNENEPSSDTTVKKQKITKTEVIVKASQKEEKPQPVPIVAKVKEKKRVPLLMSVPRGTQIPQQSKNHLISQFLKKSDTTTTTPSKIKQKSTVVTKMDGITDDPVIVLD